MLAEVITVGDELLLGQTVDTNSAWMGEVFATHGIALHRITSISDDAEEIVAALDEARARVDLVLMTGGLGPTRDDITKQTLANYFGMELRMNEEVLQRISAWFHGRGLAHASGERSPSDAARRVHGPAQSAGYGDGHVV